MTDHESISPAKRSAVARRAAGPAPDAALRFLSPTLAAESFAALGSDARLDVVRALVRAGPEGMTVGALQKKVGVAPSTLTHHLKFLSAAGLLEQERDGRSIICRAAYGRLEALAAFLTRECCADAAARPEEDAR